MYRSTATTLAGVPKIQDGIVAKQGGWTKATPLPADINVVSFAENPNSGVRLPPGRAGVGLMLVNASTKVIRVFPYSPTETISLGMPGQFFDVGPGGADFTCVRDGQWGVILGASLTVRPSVMVHDVIGFIDDPLFDPRDDLNFEFPEPDPGPDPLPTP